MDCRTMSHPEIIRTLGSLEAAIKRHDKQAIFSLYERLETVDWDNSDDDTFRQYDALVDRGNDLLYGTTAEPISVQRAWA